MPRRRRNPDDALERALPTDIALDVADAALAKLRAEGASAAIGGGLAMQLHGFVRNTSDIDIFSTHDIPLGPVKGRVNIGGTTYRIRHPWGTVEIDLIVRDDHEAELHLDALANTDLVHGRPVIHPDYLAIMKATAMRGKDTIDFQYLAANRLISMARIRKIIRKHFGPGSAYIMRDIEQDAKLAVWQAQRDKRTR